MALHLPAYAKLNLHLRVRGRRPDGYHELETLFQEIDLHDDLWCESTSGDSVSLVVAGSDVPAGEGNLVSRAAAAFFEATGVRRGVRFRLHKRIPVGAGLGGGSSDAATALRLLRTMCEVELSHERVVAIAAGLGADVPFFLAGGTQWGAGIGDRLTPVRDAPERHFVLLFPPFACATAAVYKNHRAQLIPAEGTDRIPKSKVLFYKELEVVGEFANDLEAAAMELYPQLEGIRDRVAGLGHRSVQLTGSGSTLFLSFPTAAEARAAAAGLAALESDGVRVLSSRSMPGRGRGGAATPPRSVAWPREGDDGD